MDWGQLLELVRSVFHSSVLNKQTCLNVICEEVREKQRVRDDRVTQRGLETDSDCLLQESVSLRSLLSPWDSAVVEFQIFLQLVDVMMLLLNSMAQSSVPALFSLPVVVPVVSSLCLSDWMHKM